MLLRSWQKCAKTTTIWWLSLRLSRRKPYRKGESLKIQAHLMFLLTDHTYHSFVSLLGDLLLPRYLFRLVSFGLLNSSFTFSLISGFLLLNLLPLGSPLIHFQISQIIHINEE
jgi:hypothetical protein